MVNLVEDEEVITQPGASSSALWPLVNFHSLLPTCLLQCPSNWNAIICQVHTHKLTRLLFTYTDTTHGKCVIKHNAWESKRSFLDRRVLFITYKVNFYHVLSFLRKRRRLMVGMSLWWRRERKMKWSKEASRQTHTWERWNFWGWKDVRNEKRIKGGWIMREEYTILHRIHTIKPLEGQWVITSPHEA